MSLATPFARYSKFIAAIIGAVTEAINVGLLPNSVHNQVSIAVTILTALGVYGTPNAPVSSPPADPPAPEPISDVERDLHKGLTGPPGQWPKTVPQPDLP